MAYTGVTLTSKFDCPVLPVLCDDRVDNDGNVFLFLFFPLLIEDTSDVDN